jgi:hypothetical protein
LLFYFLSLPERTLRAVAAGLGGLIYEAAEVLLPAWVRSSRLYQAVFARFLRITVELVGGVKGVLVSDAMGTRELAVRKAAGNVIEVASFLALGWSPLWLLAAAADLTGGTQTYLRTLVAELQRKGLLSTDADITSAEDLLDKLEKASGTMADLVDVPPLNVPEMRRSWQLLKQNTSALPNAHRLAQIYRQLQAAARREKRSVTQVSSIVAASAMRAGIQLGQLYIFDFYRLSLKFIAEEGLAAYSRRVTRPYLAAARGHFEVSRRTKTDRLLQKLRPPAPD